MNRIGRMRDDMLWFQVLQIKDENKRTGKSLIPSYIPGILLIPIEGGGILFKYIDYSFWGCALYVIGSIVYVVDSVYLWSRFGFSTVIAVQLNLDAGIIFVINALVCFFDWYAQRCQYSLMNMEVAGTEFGYSKAQDEALKLAQQ